jgi:hypothetical protein
MDQKLNRNEKHFKQFQLSNTAIAELEENTFYEIFIYNATKLKLINTHALFVYNSQMSFLRKKNRIFEIRLSGSQNRSKIQFYKVVFLKNNGFMKS